ncbi:SAM-dependent methyltransferase [Parabacteroides sp. OttesenSCG-928-J18]|nr:SAM-dependent methyltransferase [Parabacteroides sp. OttesenSCG-928-J18]
MNKGLLNELIKTQDLNDLEKHLVYSYLLNHNLDYKNSILLSEYFANFEPNTELFLNVQNLQIDTIKTLENHLELIMPINDRKLNGAFFTPDYIVQFIINEIQPKYDDRNLDPSCGCGAFLIGLVDYYKNVLNKSIKTSIQENIYGSDILKYNIYRTKIILTIYALQNGELLENSDFNLYHQDSLKAKWSQQFDNIIGNPPYVKFQDLSDENREFLANSWTTVQGGTFNLYFAFFELGYNLLKPTGKLGYITPNNYFTSLSGESIRKYFHEKKCVSRIIDFSHKKVFNVQTYTAITFLTKKENDSILFDRIIEEYSPEQFLPLANGSINHLNDLNAKKWRLLKKDEQKIIKAIETIGTPIGKLFDICVGIATLKDDVFFIDGSQEKDGYYIKTTQRGVFKIEKESTRSVYKISDFKNQEEVNINSRKIIFPYDLKEGIAIAIPEEEYKARFPKCYDYLLSEKEALQSRDKGKVKFEPFFAWGRTQGITRTGKRLLNPTFSQKPRFLLIEDESSYFTNGYGIFFKEKKPEKSLFEESANPLCEIKNIDVVQKILNSALMDYYVSKTSVSIEGGYPCYQKNFIENFTIPDFTKSDIHTLRKLDNKQEINAFLTNKYHLDILIGANLSL